MQESVPIPKIDFNDNIDCIILFEGKGVGLFDLLDEENRLPKPNFQHFTNEVSFQFEWCNFYNLDKHIF